MTELTRTRALRSFADVERELDRMYAELNRRPPLRLRLGPEGAPVFRTLADAAAMNPPPVAGDCWLVLENSTLYLQGVTDELQRVTAGSRQRLALAGTLETA